MALRVRILESLVDCDEKRLQVRESRPNDGITRGLR